MFGTVQPVSSLLSNIANYTSNASGNGTADALQTSDMLPRLLETFIPGYGMIRRVALEIFGLDVTLFLPLVAILLALHAGGAYVFNYVRDALHQYCTCAVDMSEWDEPYEAIMRWLNEKNHFRKTRYLRVAGRWWDRITQQPEQAFAISQNLTAEGLQTDGTSRTPIYNPEAKKPTGFEPDEGKYYFWYRGRPFCLDLYFKEMKHRETNFRKIRLSCFSLSTQPIKDLINEALAMDIEEEQMTDFFRPYPDDSEWKRVNSRPPRPLDTVTLDTPQKTKIVRDVNDFIHPARKQWYSSRGIPYRRGYLFSGPPGTGKTSLSLALAGVFNLGLYAVSIQDPTMSDTRLTELFDDLPSQCIVLLEDIDGAGIVHSRSTESGDGTEEDDDSEPEGQSKQQSKRQVKRSKVTLAGLLNAIDGVASHEGHILVMTTNHPEKLDNALKRPGRVDLHIEFTLATTFQAREIFLRLFTDENPFIKQQMQPQDQVEGKGSLQSQPKISKISAKASKLVHKRPTTVEEACRERWELSEHQYSPFMPFTELQSLADKFAKTLPERTFSPAEIQGYLLLHKANPIIAANEVKAWALETIRQNQSRGPTYSSSIVVESPSGEADSESEQAEIDSMDIGQSQVQVHLSPNRNLRRRLPKHRTKMTDDGTLTPGPSDEENDADAEHFEPQRNIENRVSE